MYTWEQFQTAYQASNTEIRSLIDSETIPNQVSDSLPKLSESQQRLVIKAVTGYILQILPLDQLEVILQQQNIAIDELTLSKITLGATATPQVVTPVRTMAADMQTAREGQTHISNQDALLQQNQVSKDPDSARWQQTN